ncbi:acyl carrier protein [Caloramator sp. CAR-1]|uniref:acyl carrier protein n=1 Tax=Caloramator sp. CAR-1 TaxID=3062777 RepID=UPI0026E2AB96|nr:acyl carrier protein [Caloramator sp. CAR-1]MDO6355392.1 acyl carrier protein [Caloramator sp. CAR-1]
MEDKILEIASSVFNIDKAYLNINISKDELSQWDSLAHIQLISEIEDTFNIEIPINDFWKINSLKQILNYLK